MIRELMWALAAVGGALLWFLWHTSNQFPLIEELLGQETLWAVVQTYAGTVLVRIAWWALRAAARAAK